MEQVCRAAQLRSGSLVSARVLFFMIEAVQEPIFYEFFSVRVSRIRLVQSFSVSKCWFQSETSV